jgi:opacity protein-like surface antigen
MNKFFKIASVAVLALAAGSSLASEAVSQNKSVARGKTDKISASSSNGSNKFYLKGIVGYTFAQEFKVQKAKVSDIKLKSNKFNKFGLGAGYEAFENLRVEALVNYLSSAQYRNQAISESFKVTIINPMLNAHYDLGNFSNVTPFVSAGLGFSKITLQDAKEKDSGYGFAYMMGAGVGYEVTQDVVAELSYAYTHFGSIKNDPIKTKVRGHSVNAGLRVKL